MGPHYPLAQQQAQPAGSLSSSPARSTRLRYCLGKLLAGEISYPGGQPDALSRQQVEAGYALFCSAFASSDLTIELIVPEFAG